MRPACWLFTGIAFGQKTTIKRLITGRDGANVNIKTNEGSTVTVTLDDSTKVQAVKGKLGLRRSDMGFTALVPGLPIAVEAEGPANELVAKNVKFKASDLKTTNQVQAGLTPTREEVQANQQELQAQSRRIQANKAGIEANQEQIQKTQRAGRARQVLR